jgi:serine/threonine protein kinase
MNDKTPGDGDANAANTDPFADPDEPTRMVTPGMRPDATGKDKTSQTGTSRTGTRTGTGTGTFSDLAALSDGPVQILQEGDLLKERFVLEARLGTGGMGTVYKALDLRKQEAEDRNPYIAVKILNEDFRAHPESLRTLQRESKKAQSLAHPSIVTVYDFDRDGTSIYMTMEYLEGKPLDRITKAPGFKGLPLAQALEIIDDVGQALAFAHKRGIVHCDFKPGNIFITETGPAKVIDFGIARAVKLGDDPNADATVFDAGSLGALTPAYASPEMLEELEPDPRDDVYALACIAYELITGRHPFGRMPATEARDNGLEPKQPKELSRKQWKALLGGLAFERTKRTANVETFLEELRDGGGRTKMFSLTGLAAGVLVVGGAGLYLTVFQSGQPDEEKPAVVASSGVGAKVATQEVPAVSEIIAPAEVPRTAPSAPVEPAQQPAAAAPQEPAVTQEALAPPAHFTSDDVDQLLHHASCSDVRYSIDGNRVTLRGHSGATTEVDFLRDKVAALPGVEGTSSEVGRVDGALCGPLDLYAPYVHKNRIGNYGLSIQSRNPDGLYVENENLVVDLKLPGFESYVYVDYYSLDGGVLHMLPNVSYPENQGAAGIEVSLGDADSARNWSIAAPFGTEMVVVLTSPVPLFEESREEVEFADTYLSALRQNLERVERGSNAEQLSADIFFITTAPEP